MTNPPTPPVLPDPVAFSDAIMEKIEPDLTYPRYVETVFGVGYRFASDADSSERA